MNKEAIYTKILFYGLTGAIIVGFGAGAYGILLYTGFPDYGMCADRTFKISYVYLVDHDVIVNEEGMKYFLSPFNHIGDVIPRDKALFIAFTTYGEKKNEIGLISIEKTRGLWFNVFSEPDFIPTRDVSILLELRDTTVGTHVQKGEQVRLFVDFTNGLSCTWHGVVR